MKVIDLFCGAGGATCGMEASGVAEVIACINHDPLAIRSHAVNHPKCLHYTEDIRLFNEKILPECDVIWMSAECTHYSIAKGGESRNADSRTLSEEIYRYVKHCNPSYIIVENVKEFLSWGPLVQKKDAKGNLVFKSNGEPHMVPDVDVEQLGSDYRNWVKELKKLGYENYRYKLLNSADFGAPQSRTRYFGIFAKKGFPIRFPSPTHNKTGVAGLQKWLPVKDYLDFDDKGESIFDRQKPLVENTLKRIHAGLLKFVGPHVLKFLSNNPRTGVNRGASLEEPLHTITTQGRMGLIQTSFLEMAYTGNTGKSIEEPAGAITTINHHRLVQTSFLHEYYGNGFPKSLESPCNTILTKDKYSLIQQSFLLDDNFGNTGHHLDKPHPTVMASKRYTHLVQPQKGSPVTFKDDDTYWMRQIKTFCQEHGISDVFMRMLRVSELKKIQGFPDEYVLLGSQEKQKKFIGNSVVPIVAQKIIEALHQGLQENKVAA
jgi:DNA (cytosine-5)-methyltransferase 1